MEDHIKSQRKQLLIFVCPGTLLMGVFGLFHTYNLLKNKVSTSTFFSISTVIIVFLVIWFLSLISRTNYDQKKKEEYWSAQKVAGPAAVFGALAASLILKFAGLDLTNIILALAAILFVPGSIGLFIIALKKQGPFKTD